jgi:hypothetical protein
MGVYYPDFGNESSFYKFYLKLLVLKTVSAAHPAAIPPPENISAYLF